MGTGKTFIALGLLCLGFVAYELLGTNLAEARHQHDLRAQLRSVLPGADQAPGGAPTPAPAPTPTGKAVAIIEIPSIGVNKAVVEGVELTDLKLGPGHYPGTPLPGQPGNAAIAGHRTTYGAPFFNIDQVKPGDKVFVTTKQGRFEYKASETRIVKPSEVSVVAPTPDNRLTLTSCNPRFSAAQRIVLVSQLVGPAAPAAPPVANQPKVTEVVGATSDPKGRAPAILWGLATLVLGAAIWALGRRWRRWAAYLVGVAPFVVVLFVFYENLARVIPS
jgi:sortase A